MIVLSVNGENIAPADSVHPVLSHEFLLQRGIFETLRIYSGVPFMLREHIARFHGAAGKMDIPIPCDIEALVEDQIARAAATGLRSAFLRLTLTESDNSSTLVTMIAVLPQQLTGYANGISVVTAATARDEFAPTTGIKTTAWLVHILRFRSETAGAGDAMLLDTSGHISEATASNIFLVINGALLTPPTSCGALPGITRATVISLARTMGFDVQDSRPIRPEQIQSASEIFLTSSVREIVPVIEVDGRVVGAGTPGVLTRRLMRAYKGITA